MQRVTRGQDKLLETSRTDDGPVVVVDDRLVVYDVAKASVGHLQLDPVAGSQLVDVSKRVKMGRAVTGDGDRPTEAW